MKQKPESVPFKQELEYLKTKPDSFNDLCRAAKLICCAKLYKPMTMEGNCHYPPYINLTNPDTPSIGFFKRYWDISRAQVYRLLDAELVLSVKSTQLS